MPRSAPRSIAQYLTQLRNELAGEDAALVQDALYDAGAILKDWRTWSTLAYMVLMLPLGVVLLTALMHVAKHIGRLHGALAKALLVTGAAGHHINAVNKSA